MPSTGRIAVPPTRHNDTHARRSPGTARARQRIAAQRAAQERTQARRRWLISLAAVGAVLAIVAGFVAVKLTSGTAAATRESAAPQNVVTQVTTVPAATLARVRGSGTITPLRAVKAPGPVLSIAGKPAIVFVAEESCPFCAAERWPLTVALSHFGTWSHVGATRSAATDVFPNTATLSFRTASYRSAHLTLRTTELADNRGHRLQPLTPLDTTLIHRYDVPPYVNSADQSGAVPFLDIGNRYILAGAQYNPQILAGLSQAQIASQLANPASPIAKAIDGSANLIIAAIDNVLHHQVSG
jgi:Domain of unknown function (DUF929)